MQISITGETLLSGSTVEVKGITASQVLIKLMHAVIFSSEVRTSNMTLILTRKLTKMIECNVTI
jgi:hypothetical protein